MKREVLESIIKELKQERSTGKNVKKQTWGLDLRPNDNFALKCITLFVLPTLRDYIVEVPHFKFYGGVEHKTTTFSFFSWTSIRSFQWEIKFQK